MITNLVPVQGLQGNKPSRIGRLFRKLVKVALIAIENIPYVGGVVVQAVEELTNIDGWIEQAKTAAPEYQPTASEEAILNAWVNNVFNPFYKKLAQDLATAFQSPSVTVQLAGINRALARMCVVTTHYASSGTAGLSPQAVLFRTDLLAELFDPIVDLIDQSITSTDLEIVIDETDTKVIPADFPNMGINGGSFYCLQYAIASGTSVTEIENTTIPKPSVPVTTGPIAVPVDTAPMNPGTNPQTTTTQNTPRRKRMFFTIAAVCLIAYGLSEDEKEKSSN